MCGFVGIFSEELIDKSFIESCNKHQISRGPDDKQYMYKKDNIKYNISVTDECINLEETEKILDLYYKSIK